MPGPSPNPRSEDSRGWKVLPLSVSHDVPVLTDWHPWSERARELWHVWWSSPMSSEWIVEDGSSLERLLFLTMTVWGEVTEDRMLDDGSSVRVPVSASGVTISEARMLGDQFGLTPASRLRLRWRVAGLDAVDVVAAELGSGDVAVMPSPEDLGLRLVR